METTVMLFIHHIISNVMFIWRHCLHYQPKVSGNNQWIIKETGNIISKDTCSEIT